MSLTASCFTSWKCRDFISELIFASPRMEFHPQSVNELSWRCNVSRLIKNCGHGVLVSAFATYTNGSNISLSVPPMMTIPHQLEGGYIGQEITLECQTEAHPKSINYWTTDRGDMIVSGKISMLVTVGVSFDTLSPLCYFIQARNTNRSWWTVATKFTCVSKFVTWLKVISEHSVV